MSFLSDVRMRHTYGWVSIFWFTAAVSIGDSVRPSVELQAVSEVTARCGENVTLTCDTSSLQLDVKLFTLHGNNKTCRYGHHQADSELVCESMAESNHHRLIMTLLNVMPLNQGKYNCKLHATQGINFATSVVIIQDCLDDFSHAINESHAKCWFGGVYPRGIIHWHRNEVNLTDSANTWEEKDRYGRHKGFSIIDVQKGNLSQPYVCSLWIPSVGKYRNSLELYMRDAQKSSGDMIHLQRSIIIVEIFMVTFVK